ncbi:MAG: type II toxin-antitoxin system HicA family toxin [Burkholderiales bacterium]|nr:type II toxin-antitoxin system HicA family toxin [Burkholderiales bacterium]
MQRKHLKTLGAIFARPVQSSIRWKDIESLFVSLGATIQEREGSRIAVILMGQVQVFHRPHPSPMTDKGAVASVRRWLESNNITPETINNQTPDEEEDDEKHHDH